MNMKTCDFCGENMKQVSEFKEYYICDCCGEKEEIKEKTVREKARDYQFKNIIDDVPEWDHVTDAYIAGYEQAIKDLKYKISKL